MTKVSSIALYLAVVALSTTARVDAREYRLHVLPSLPGDTYGSVTGLNSQHRAVGTSASDSRGRRTVCTWDDTGIQSLGFRLSGLYSSACINENGDIAADRYVIRAGVKIQLPATDPSPSYSSWASCINNAGVVAGSSYNGSTGDEWACYWDASVNVHRLPVTPYYGASRVNDINDSGQMACDLGLPSVGTLKYACVWKNGAFTQINVLSGFDYNYASAINNLGQVVGASCSLITVGQNLITRRRAFMWQNGSLQTICGTDRNYQPLDINDRGQIVGFSQDLDCATPSKALLYENDQVAWLEGLGGHTYATVISSDGWIGGRSCDQYGVYHPVIWEPIVPEPSGVLALLAGMFGIARYRKRRR